MIAAQFLDNLATLMRNHDLSQTKLGLGVDLPQQTISNWFRRRKLPDDKHIEALAKYFNVEPYYFFMEPGTQGNVRPVERHDDFKTLLDDLAIKCLSEVELDSYRRGGVSEYVRVLRINYESKEHMLPVGWCLKLNAELVKYASIDLPKKLNLVLAEQAAKKEQSS